MKNIRLFFESIISRGSDIKIDGRGLGFLGIVGQEPLIAGSAAAKVFNTKKFRWKLFLSLISGATLLIQAAALAQSMKSMNYQTHRCNRVVKKKRDAIGKLGGKDIVIGKASFSSKSKSAVNGDLLVKAVTDEMSQYPLISSDAAAGLFVTDWLPVGNLNIKQKISTNILSKNKLSVRVFRMAKDKSGDWVAIDSDKNLEEKIHKSIIAKSKR